MQIKLVDYRKDTKAIIATFGDGTTKPNEQLIGYANEFSSPTPVIKLIGALSFDVIRTILATVKPDKMSYGSLSREAELEVRLEDTKLALENVRRNMDAIREERDQANSVLKNKINHIEAERSSRVKLQNEIAQLYAKIESLNAEVVKAEIDRKAVIQSDADTKDIIESQAVRIRDQVTQISKLMRQVDTLTQTVEAEKKYREGVVKEYRERIQILETEKNELGAQLLKAGEELQAYRARFATV